MKQVLFRLKATTLFVLCGVGLLHAQSFPGGVTGTVNGGILRNSYSGAASVSSTNQIATNWTYTGTTTVTDFYESLASNPGVNDFKGYIYNGYIDAASAGTYQFQTCSDDGSRLFIDGVQVVDNDFNQALTCRSGSIALTAGAHDIEVYYYNNVGPGEFGNPPTQAVAWDLPGGGTSFLDLNNTNIFTSSQLAFWYRASWQLTCSANRATNWVSEFIGTTATPINAANAPTCGLTTLNEEAVIAMGTAEGMTIPSNISINSLDYAAKSYIAAFRTGADVTTTQVLYEEGGGTNGLVIYVSGGRVYACVYQNGAAAPLASNLVCVSGIVAANTPYIITFEYNGGGNTSLRINGVNAQTLASSFATLPAHTGGIGIGQVHNATIYNGGVVQNTDGDPFLGTIAELIGYNKVLTTGERDRIESYLAIRYGITVNHDYLHSGNVVLWSYAGNPYHKNVAGIGRDNAVNGSNLNKTRSTCQNPGTMGTLITVEGTAAANFAHLVWGVNDNTTAPAFSSNITGVPGSSRLNKIWMAKETGDINNQIVYLSPSVVFPATGTRVVIVSNDATFDNTDNIIPMTFNGSQYTANLGAALGNNGAKTSYFSFATIPAPGGIATETNNEAVRLWLDAKTLGLANNANVNTWSDKSGGGLNAVTGSAPKHFVDRINFNPAVDFITNDYLQIAGGIFGNSATINNSNLFIVSQTQTNGTHPVVHQAHTADEYAMWLPEVIAGTPYATAETNNDNNLNATTTGFSAFPTSFQLWSLHAHNSILPTVNPNFTNRSIYLNGALQGSDNSTPGFTTLASGNVFYLGYEPGGGGTYFDGDIAEVIVHTGPLTPAEQKKIHSYLAIKYGLTLLHDYTNTNNTIVWSQVINAGYNSFIAGIGIDNATTLNQPKSKSSVAGSVLTIEGTPNNNEFFVWGNNNQPFAPFNNTAAPIGTKRSDRVWRVQSTGYGTKTVDLTFDLTTVLSGSATPEFSLLINSTPNFQNGSIGYSATADYVNKRITFSGILINDGDYFTLCKIENPPTMDVVNQQPGSPSTWEACVNSVLTISYTNLPSIPAFFQITTKTGIANLVVPAHAPTIFNGSYNGSFPITIPNNGTTGPIALLDATSAVIFVPINELLMVHNPDIAFSVVQNPVCSRDTATLSAIPTGGVFSSTVSGVVSGTNFYATNASNSAVLYNSMLVPVTYTYTPRYTNGALCAQSLSVTNNVTIYDNRLNFLELDRVIVPSINFASNSQVDLDTMINIVQPSLMAGMELDFFGTFVSNPSDHFLYGLSRLGSFPVIASYDNNGCRAELETYLDVLPPIGIPGLPTYLCREADTVHFRRSSYFLYSYQKDTIYIPGTSQIDYIRTSIRNELNTVPVTTVNPAHSVAISTGSLSPINQEYFIFNPLLIPATDTAVTIRMRYKNTLIVDRFNYDPTNPGWYSVVQTVSNSFFYGEQTVVLKDRPNVVIDPVLTSQYFWCENTPPFSLHSNPIFETPPYTTYWTRHLATNGIDTFALDSVLDIQALYNQYNPAQTNDQLFRLYYRIDKYGCVDIATYDFRVVRPEHPQIIGAEYPTNIYCFNQAADLLAVTPSFSSGNGGIFNGAGLGVTNAGLAGPVNMFSPVQAGVGVHPITYTYTDQYGCVSDTTVVFEVRPTPDIQLVTDNHATEYCADVTAVGLHLESASGNIASNVLFTGQGLQPLPSDTLFHPNQALLGAGGTVPITANFTDIYGCSGQDVLLITIRDVPVPTISASVQNRYCENSPIALLTGMPAYTGLTNGASGVFSGPGVYLLDTLYYFDPAVPGSGLHNLVYTFESQYGCIGIATKILEIDTTPNTRILNLPETVCVNGAPFIVQALPNTSSAYFTPPVFGGIGITSPNTGLFNPAAAGSGVRVISYTFRDQNQCESTAYDTIEVVALPQINFSGLAPEYCTDYGLDTLFGSSSVLGIGYFTGAAIADSVLGILNTNLDTTGLRTITYVFTDTANNCVNQLSKSYFIHPLPVISIAGANAAYCNSHADDIITGAPVGVGGSFNIPGTNNLPTGVTNFALSQIRFSPSVAASAGQNHTIYYSFTDNRGCYNLDSIPIQVFSPSVSPQIIGLDTQYCATRDTVDLVGIPAGGIFSGLIVSPGSSHFVPANGGGGNYDIVYSVTQPFVYGAGNTLYCTNSDTSSTTIRPLPIPQFNIAPNSNYCIQDTAIALSGTLAGGGVLAPNTIANPSLYFFGSGVITQTDFDVDTTVMPNGTIVITQIPINSYFFDPSSVVAGSHALYFAARNIYGCVDTTQITVNVYSEALIAGTQFDSAYCEQAEPIILIPNGGAFSFASGTLLTGGVYDPDAIGLPAAPRLDTLIFTNDNGPCVRLDSFFIEVYPNPSADFSVPAVPDLRFCFTDDTVNLVPISVGANIDGAFYGDGTRYGQEIFIPALADTGTTVIVYQITDTITGCGNSISKLFHVFSQPQVAFVSKGGCATDSIIFIPDNNGLGLSSMQDQIDSITLVKWFFGNGDSLVLSNFTENTLDTLHFTYPNGTAFVGESYLIVENQGLCVDTAIVRVAVSPLVTATTALPYIQDFESSDGQWIGESAGQVTDTLWQWGTPAADSITAASPTIAGGSHVWMTALNGSYPTNVNTWIYSPCFDITQLQRPMISLDYWVQTAENADGAVVEYWNDTLNKWSPLGLVDRGINWFNSDLIIAKPGAQDFTTATLPDGTTQLITPIGWSGYDTQWRNGRYMLDDYVSDRLRLRISFGTSAVNAGGVANGTQGDGFAFDNVILTSRTRNALLEYFSHEEFQHMGNANYLVYGTLMGPVLYQDAVHIQYHAEFEEYSGSSNPPSLRTPDEYENDNIADSRSRLLFYGVSAPANAIINGENKGSLTSPWILYSPTTFRQWFEQEILEDPAFMLNTNMQIVGNTMQLNATVQALQDMPFGRYTVQLVVVQDNLNYSAPPLAYYPNPATPGAVTNKLNGVMRKMVPNHSGTDYEQTWSSGDVISLSKSWTIDPAMYTNWNPLNAEIVAFIQNNATKEVYQVATSRVITQFFVDVESIEGQEAQTDVEGMRLYPNPATDYVQVDFDQALAQDYDWQLVGVNGQLFRKGQVSAGTQFFTVEGLEELAAGMYFLVLQNNAVRTQRPFIVRRP